MICQRCVCLILITFAICASPLVAADESKPALVSTPRIEQLTRKIEATPADPAPLADRGFAYAALGEKTLAIADFERALAMGPDNWNVHWSYGWALFALSHYDDAMKHWQRAIDLNNERPWWAGHTLALGYWMLDKKVEAARSYAEAAKVNPDKFLTREDLSAYTAFWTTKERDAIQHVFDAWKRGYQAEGE